MNYLKKLDYKKVFITFIAVIFMGITLSVLNLINYGMDSFTYMNVSISGRIGWSLGNWQILINVIMFIPVIIWGRKQIGIGTVFNMVLVGYTVDFCMWIWGKTGFANLLSDQFVKIVFMLVALVIFILAAATYMSTDLGTAPFDALPIIISENLPKVSFKIIRFLWDLSAIIIGFTVSGKVGIVTILMMIFLGPTVGFVRGRMFKN